MAGTSLFSVLRQFRRLGGNPDTAEESDGALLRRFAEQREEAAFAALVQRHGPLVWDVCRHILPVLHDAEDAFQATFLVLASRPGSIRKRESLASWLHGVAYRVALRLRCEAARRTTHETKAGTMPRSILDPAAEAAQREARALVHEELQQLPPRYRDPLVLFYLEGHSYEETARRLCCPVGTVRSRLARGRTRLQSRLARRGLTLSAGCLAAAAPVEAARAAAATRAARVLALGQTAGETASARALLLAQRMLATMTAVRWKSVLALLLAVGVLAAGTGQPGADAPAEKQAAPRGPDKRESAAPLPPGAIACLGSTRFAAGVTVESVAFAPNGKVIASGNADRTIRLWDRRSGRELRRLQGHQDPVTAVVFSPDGKLLASRGGQLAYLDNSIRLWDAATGKELRRFGGVPMPRLPPRRSHSGSFGWAFALAFSADCKLLASGAGDTDNLDGAIRLWDVASGKALRVLRGHSGRLRAFTFSPAGRTLASAGADGTVRLWDADTGKERRCLRGHTGEVWSVAFSADGKTLASGGEDHTARLWNVTTGKEKEVLKGQQRAKAVAFAPDGRTFAWSDGPLIRLRGPDGKERRLPGPRCGVSRLSFSRDGRTLAALGDGLDDYAIPLWDVATGKSLSPGPGGHRAPVSQVTFAADGKRLASASEDNTVRLWDTRTGKELGRSLLDGSGVYAVVFSPDARLVAAAVNGATVLRLWEPTTGKKHAELRMPPGWLAAPVFAPDFKVLAAGWNRFDPAAREGRGTPCLWDVATGKELRRCKGHHRNSIRGLAFTADSKKLVTGGEDNCVRVWDVASGRELRQLEGHKRWVLSVDCSPDGRTIASADGATIRLWDVNTGRALAVLTQEGVASVRFAPDGKTLVAGGYDRTVRLWEVATGKERHCFVGHQNSVQSVAFAADGRAVASGGRDTLIFLWDVTGRLRGGRLQAEELSAADLERLWTDLADADAVKAYRALWRLVASPRPTLPFLAKRLPPLPPPDREAQQRIARLIADLDDDRFAVREKATAELAKQVVAVGPALRRALEGKPSLEARRRLETLVSKLPRPEDSPERLRGPRVLEVLEQIGTTEARRLLKEMTQRPEPGPAEEAKASLRRLDRRATR